MPERDRRWGPIAAALLLCLVAVGLWLRLRQLSADGFADDEVHKWLAAQRYLHGQFGGDDVEHPMLMKWLIALCIAVFPHLAPETLTRLPNALAGGVSIWLVALLGRRLFGRAAGLLAAALTAVSPALVGYQRVAKEDTLFGVFLLLMLWCLAEARERHSRRWELCGALALAGMMASKYYVFFAPLPLLVYRAPLRRWVAFFGLALAAFFAVNWTPLFPSTWAYLADHIAGRHVSTPTLFYEGAVYPNLPLRADGVPWSFYFVFAIAKLTPPVLLLSLAGLWLARRERTVLAWLGLWFLVFTLSGAKYGRYFVSVMPAFFLLAGFAMSALFKAAYRWAMARSDSLPGALQQALRPLFACVAAAPLALAGFSVLGEWRAALLLSPHSRMYVSPLAGADVDWLFPHCDYFDAGLREAVRRVSALAEPGAEIAAAADLPVRFYARGDLRVSTLREDEACRSGAPCYVIVQPGRIYAENRAALDRLAPRPPWHVEFVEGHAAATVYRLDPGDSPFPPSGETSARK